RYGNGAEFVLQSEWPNDKPPDTSAMGGPSDPAAELAAKGPIHYLEPPFDPYRELPGVASAAKVFVKKNAVFNAGEQSGTAQLIGIDTDDFGHTSWFPEGLLDHPFYEYLNLIASDSRGVLISRT